MSVIATMSAAVPAGPEGPDRSGYAALARRRIGGCAADAEPTAAPSGRLEAPSESDGAGTGMPEYPNAFTADGHSSRGLPERNHDGTERMAAMLFSTASAAGTSLGSNGVSNGSSTDARSHRSSAGPVARHASSEKNDGSTR